MGNWYLLRCKPRQEERATGNLARQGLTYYCPRIHVDKSNCMVTKSAPEPLFPGYIFIQLNHENNWTAIRSTRGILDFVRFGLYPTIVPEEVISQIVENLQKKECNIAAAVEFPKGAVLRVVKGCFEGLEAIYKCRSGTERSIILISMLNKLTEVNIENIALKRV